MLRSCLFSTLITQENAKKRNVEERPNFSFVVYTGRKVAKKKRRSNRAVPHKGWSQELFHKQQKSIGAGQHKKKELHTSSFDIR